MSSFKIKIKGIVIPRSVFIVLTGLYMAGVMISSSHPALEVAGADKNIMKHIYNFAHLPVYSVLTFLLLGSFDSFTPVAQGAAFWTSFAFGVFNELIQSHVPGRYFQVSDMMTNGAGALLTLLILKIREARLVKRTPIVPDVSLHASRGALHERIMMNFKAFLRMNFCRLIFHGGLLHAYLKFVFSRRREFPAVIVNYHSFVQTLDDVIEVESSVVHRMETFKKEVEWLRKYFEIVPLDTVVETLSRGGTFAKPTVAITIDDGFRDNFELLFPYLKEANLPVTIFLATGLIGTQKRIWIDRVANIFLQTKKTVFTAPADLGGKQFPLDSIPSRRNAYDAVSGPLKAMPVVQRDKNVRLIEEQLGAIPEDKPVMLDWDQVRTMHKNGVSFGAHTRTHPILTSLSFDEAKQEIADSREKIEDELKITVKHFAYPNGREEDFSEELRQFCKEAGFRSVSAVAMGNNSEPSDVWALKRIGAKLPLSFCAFHVTQAFLMTNHDVKR